MTVIEEINIYPEGTISSPIQYVEVSKVKVDPQERIRKEFEDYQKSSTYIALKNSIIKYGVRNPISLRADYVLVEGFYRFMIVLELSWQFIPAFIDNLSERQAIELELEENLCRKNFNDYSVYCGIARLKEIYERENPDAKKGKHSRYLNDAKDPKSISASDALMNSDQRQNNIESFVGKYTKELGIARRTLFLKVQIGEAIRTGRFNQKTIKALQYGNISERKLIEKLKKLENRQIGEKDLRIDADINKSLSKASDINERIYNDNKGNTSTKLKVTKLKKNENKNKSPQEPPKKLEFTDFAKSQEIIEASQNDKEIKDLWGKVKTGLMSIDNAYKDMFKIKSLKSTMRMEDISRFKEIARYSKNEISSSSKKRNEKRQDLSRMYICKRCSKATVVTQEKICKKCGYLNQTFSVICDDDYSNGLRKLRDPNALLCKNSPDYDLIAKSQPLK
jgi:ribosomal protein L37E